LLKFTSGISYINFISVLGYSDSNHNVVLNPSNIYNRADFKYSSSETSLIPGLLLGSTLQAEIGKHPAFVKRIRMGGKLSTYSEKMNILVRDKSRFIY